MTNASCICRSGKESFLVWLFSLQNLIQKCKLPSFFLTNTSCIAPHGDWLGLITPESNTSLRVFCTSSSMGGGILQNLSLYGSRSVKLIACSTVLVHPNSFFSRANILWYSIRSSLAAFVQFTQPDFEPWEVQLLYQLFPPFGNGHSWPFDCLASHLVLPSCWA